MLYTNRLLTSGLTQLFAILMLAGATHLEINAMNPGAHGGLMGTDDDARITGAVVHRDPDQDRPRIKQENIDANKTTVREIADTFFPQGTGTEALDDYLAAQRAYFAKSASNEGNATMTMPEPTTVTTEHLQAQGLALPPTLESGRPSKRARIIVRANFTDQKNQQSHSSSSSSSSSSTPAPTTSPLTPPPCDLPQTPTALTHAAARFAAAAKQQQQQQQQQEEEEEAQKKAANIDSGDDDAMTTKAVSEHAKESDGNEPDGRSTDLKRKTRPHKCEHPGCGRSFTERSNLQRHILLHTGEKPHKCTHDGCGTSFADSSNFTKHMLLHTGKRPFPCTYDGCGKRFAQNDTLQTHMRTHTGKKPYPCTYDGCGKSFAHRSTLKRHREKHTEEKSHKCTYKGCGKSFTRQDSLRRHQECYNH